LTFVNDLSAQEDRLHAFPNPFSSELNLEFEMKETSSVSVEIFDVSGKLVQRLDDTEMNKGQHRLNLNTSSLKAGVYFIRLQAGQERISIRQLKR
jgi:hypothetical protein